MQEDIGKYTTSYPSSIQTVSGGLCSNRIKQMKRRKKNRKQAKKLFFQPHVSVVSRPKFLVPKKTSSEEDSTEAMRHSSLDTLADTGIPFPEKEKLLAFTDGYNISSNSNERRKSSVEKEKSSGTLRRPRPSLVHHEFEHMYLFFLAQLRFETKFIIDSARSTDDFDAEIRRIDPNRGVSDLATFDKVMQIFFSDVAKDDKWVPWHTVLCQHEAFLHQEVYSALSNDRDKIIWLFIFSASREIPLFRDIFLPILLEKRSKDSASCGSSSSNSSSSSSIDTSKSNRDMFQEWTFPSDNIKDGPYAWDGELHRLFREYRDNGRRKLHTRAFQIHPPKGVSGDKFTYFIVERTWQFARLGHRIYTLMKSIQDSDAHICMQILDEELRKEYRIGDTMSKMFMVSIALLKPGLYLLDDECRVGNGAAPALKYLYGDECNRHHSNEALLEYLVDDVKRYATAEDQRLETMIAWCAKRARGRFKRIPAKSISDQITAYDMQVNLCEWRKFREKVHRSKSAIVGEVLSSMVSHVAAVNCAMETENVLGIDDALAMYREQHGSTSTFSCVSCEYTCPAVASVDLSRWKFCPKCWHFELKPGKNYLKVCDVNGAYFCDFCHGTFKSPRALKIHRSKSRCNVGGNKRSTYEAMHHSSSPSASTTKRAKFPRVYACATCNETFTSKSKRRKHQEKERHHMVEGRFHRFVTETESNVVKSEPVRRSAAKKSDGSESSHWSVVHDDSDVDRIQRTPSPFPRELPPINPTVFKRLNHIIQNAKTVPFEYNRAQFISTNPDTEVCRADRRTISPRKEIVSVGLGSTFTDTRK